MSAVPSKGELRAAALAKRDALSDKQRNIAAQALAKRGLPNEIDPAPLMEKLAKHGAKLALPTINARGKALVFRSYHVGDRLMLGSLGIPEPSPAAAEVVPDIMLVPLAAFDRIGHRIGYGAGHYDHTFAHLRKVKATTGIGLAFAAQEIKAIPALPHDVRLDFVLTESGTFDFRRL